MSVTTSIIARISEYAESIIIALFGGGVSYLVRRQRTGRGFVIFEFITGSLIGGFAGFAVSLLCQAAGLKQNYSYFLVAMSGYMGGRLLDTLEAKAFDKIDSLTGGTKKKHFDEEGNNKDGEDDGKN